MVAVPISLDWPAQRVIDILERFSNPILVGTIPEQLRSSANRIGVPVLAPKTYPKKRGRFLNRVGLHDIAYITCTSGTTGIPKMVCTEFSGHSNLAAAYTRAYLLHNYSHTYQVVNYGFDIFFADLTKTLVNGASITLAEGLIPNLNEMDGVTNAYIMPAYLSSLSCSDIERLAFLESIHFGGEAIQPSALRLLLQIGAGIYHEHGMTEQTVYTTCNRMDVCSPIPEIGAPYRNLHHYLRDEDGQLLPNKYQGIYYINGYNMRFVRMAKLTRVRSVFTKRTAQESLPLALSSPVTVGDVERAVVDSFKKYTKRDFMADECFFDFGGDSVKAMLVVQDLAAQGYELELRTLFSLRTAEKIACYLESKRNPAETLCKEVPTTASFTFEIPLSPQQKRLWFLAKMYPDRDSYIIRLQIKLSGQLDELRLRQTFSAVVMNNPATRSRLDSSDMEPVLIRLSGTECFHDLTREAHIQDPQLHDSSLVTAKITKTHQGVQLDLRIHHINSDGRSLAIIGEQLATAYNGGRIRTGNNTIRGQNADDSLEFWKVYLQDYEPPAIQAKGDAGAFNGEAGYVEAFLDFVREPELRKVCSIYGCTLYQILVVCYVQALRTVHDLSDIVIGTTVANRTPENLDVVGLFVNTIPLRFREEFTDLPTLLRYAGDQILSAVGYQSTPLAKIVEEVIVDRDVTSTPLFRHVLTLENASILELPEITGIESEVIEPRSVFAQFHQSWIFQHGTELSLLIHYDKSHCSESTIEDLLKLFKFFLNRILKQKHPIGPVPSIVSALPYDTPRCKTLGTIFNEQATILKSTVCLETSSSILNFQNTMEAAGNFANQMEEIIIQSNGELPRSDDVICIVLPESIENHITIISVHLLGCAYLCLPPDTPSERMQYVLADCQARLVVTDLTLANISVPILNPQLSFGKRTRCWTRSCSASLAYLIYTSGTTGKPKGVCVSHQSTLNMLKHATRLCGFRPGARVLQFTKSSFDASISNTFGSLLNGGILSIRDENADVVDDLVKRQPIAVLHMTPIVMEMFDEQDLSRLSEVEQWSFGGETISESALNFMLGRGQQLVQLYGPTEATCYQISLKMKLRDSSTCLGLTIPGVPNGLCSFNNPSVERKDVGQFYCSGENLARGYTSASNQGFIDNPHRTHEDRLSRRNHRVYLTGDKLRRDQQGHLHFLGRNDDQVKVNGQRIQLSEIEAVARSVDGVTNAVAVVQKDKMGFNHIVLFYTGAARDPLTVLQKKIPPSMLPTKIVQLSAFPLTSNRKVDRSELSLRADGLPASRAKAEPRDRVEEQVLTNYQEVLQQKELDINSNFFQAGGHSLLAVRLVAALEKSFGISVPIVKIFECPHVKDLATWIKGASEVPTEVAALKDSQNYEEPSPLQITLLRSFRNQKVQALYDLSFSVTLKKTITARKCVEMVNQLIMVHSSLRTRFARNGRSYSREVLSGTECFQNLDPETDLVLNPFKKPPFIVFLEENRICVAANHVIIDGHSMQVIVANLSQLLNQQKVPINDGHMFHLWLLQQFQNSGKDDLHYWKGMLKDYVQNQLPTTFPRLIINEPTAGTSVFSGGQLTSRVLSLVECYGCTPFVVVLTFLSKALQQLSCDPKLPIAIGFPVNLRTQNFQNSVGYGVNTALVLQDTRGAQEKVLQSMMTQVANAMSHVFLPFEELVNLSPSKELVSVMLIYDSYSVYENEELIVEPTAATVTKFEISVFIDPQADTIKFEFNRNLFNEEYIKNLAETFQNIVCDWDYHISQKVNNPIRIDGVVYDPSDITKLIGSLPIEQVRVVGGTNGLELQYSGETQIDDGIREALKMLPRALRPQKVVFIKKTTEDFPLSTQQLQMYYLSLDNPRAYVLPFLKKFPKTFLPTHLHRALLYEIQRHESLRSIFLEKEGQPRQVVLSVTEAYVALIIQNTNTMRKSVDLFMRTPLELTDGLPIRVTLFDGHDCIVAAMLLNHIISDAWSTTILEQELGVILEKLQRGERPSICRQKHSYKDYCLKHGKDAEIDEMYIKELVTAEAIPLEEDEGEVDLLRFEFPEATAQRWTKRSGVSLFVVVLMMISNSIMDKFGLRSINVGAPHANRSAETKSIIGYFLNNLVFHIKRQGDDSTAFQALQRNVADILLKNIPFSQLVTSARQLKRDLKPLFHVYFNCRYDLEVNEADDQEVMSMLPVTSEFPLEVDLEKCRGGYRMTFRMQKCCRSEYGKQIMEDIQRQLQSDLLPPPLQSDECTGPTCLGIIMQLARKVLGVETIDTNENFFSAGGNSLQVIAFVEMLEEALNVDIDIADIYQMKSFVELANLLQSIHPAQGEASHDEPLPQTEKYSTAQFRTESEPKKRSPPGKRSFSDAPLIGLSDFLLKLKWYGSRISIVEHGASEVTYAELASSIERRASSIRRSYSQITGETLRNDTIIPIIGETLGSTITTCLSIISSGAAYLPIDSSLPSERVLVLLKESNADCYVGAELSEISLRCLSTTLPITRCHGLVSNSAQEDLAYVIYTSGTTGVPKGVCIKQGAVINMMQSSTIDFHLNPNDVIYQFTNFIYDNSILEIFMTLVNGAKLVVDKVTFSPRRFISLMEQHDITHCLLFPGLVATFSESHFKRLGDLRYWIVGAEKFPQRMFNMAIEAGGKVIQNYGPTETTAYALTKHMRITDLTNNLGKTIRNTEMLVREDGELLLRGKGLMRSYLGQRRSGVLKEGSWYPSGDQVRLLPNGDVLFMGRRDNQVKIRGQRVELSEIEAVIGSVRGVKQCTVIFKEAVQILLAFITSTSVEDNVVSNVVESCSRQLPSHMRPNRVILLDELPLTKNSKVDVALLSKNWIKYTQKEKFHKLTEDFLGHKVNPRLSFVEAGGSTKQAIELRQLHISKFGRTFNITQLLEKPLKDVGEEHPRMMSNKVAKKSKMIDERLKKVWKEVLKHDNFESTDHFFFSGGNSISLIKLRYEINAEFGERFSIQQLLNSLVFSEMRAMIKSTTSSMRIAAIVHSPPTPRFNLVFIHALYGGNVPYSDLIRSLIQLDNFRIITVQHPNTFSFESDDLRFFNSVQSVAETYAAEVRQYYVN
ncbi:AMP-binding enzyme [Teladorsagia circumcincta]|uniref:Fatty acid synthase n=1 Tax=Teladorsagia circumcincta TaxID=45464 RepID=A0A2G9USC4_TELCI|nr:AMP-binding enzyme [Teladorsagia circumcincta]